MERNIFEKQRDLNDRLNRYRDEYYNRNAPSVSDEVYDRLFDELKELEQETGIQMANSPTQTVGYPAVSRLEKTRHEIPLLSLDKTKSSMDLLNFMGEQQVMLMLKLDGLTVKLTYENGELLEAATRGDGDEGEIITHNTRAISGIPSHITYKERLVVTGEGFIRPSDFEELKTSLQDSSGKPYKNGRNLAAGSIRLMDAKICQERRLVFMPFGVLEGFPHLTRKSDKLRELRALGFQPCKYLVTKQKLTLENVEAGIYQLRQYATDKDIPIDGIVVSFNDIAYAQSCGRTGHHYKDGLAYKFEDDLHESLLQYIEWTPGRTGEIAPVAVFTPVEIDGCEVSRASLHNLSFIEDLELMAGNRILVSKRNMIIPHVEENLDRGGFSMVDTIPRVCPCCGQPTRIHESSGKGENGEDRIIKTLYCDNPDCETRRLKKFVHFVSQKAMDIEGLSEAALEKFIGQGFIHSYLDIYRLDRYRAEIVRMDGFGEKSWQRLWDAIQQSRNTTFERYLISMDTKFGFEKSEGTAVSSRTIPSTLMVYGGSEQTTTPFKDPSRTIRMTVEKDPFVTGYYFFQILSPNAKVNPDDNTTTPESVAFSGTGSLFNTSFTWTAYYDALENGQYNWEFKAKGSTPSYGTIATCRFSK